jgi:hypothetical protein
MGDNRTYGNLNRNITNRAESTTFDSYRGKKTNLDIKIAQVIDIILDESHPKYNNPTDLRKIEFGIIADNNVEESFRGIATPLSGEINTLPVKNELVVILTNNTNKGNSSYYYIANVNLFNNGLYNPNGYNFQVDNQDRLDLGKNID